MKQNYFEFFQKKFFLLTMACYIYKVANWVAEAGRIQLCCRPAAANLAEIILWILLWTRLSNPLWITGNQSIFTVKVCNRSSLMLSVHVHCDCIHYPTVFLCLQMFSIKFETPKNLQRKTACLRRIPSKRDQEGRRIWNTTNSE